MEIIKDDRDHPYLPTLTVITVDFWTDSQAQSDGIRADMERSNSSKMLEKKTFAEFLLTDPLKLPSLAKREPSDLSILDAYSSYGDSTPNCVAYLIDLYGSYLHTDYRNLAKYVFRRLKVEKLDAVRLMTLRSGEIDYYLVRACFVQKGVFLPTYREYKKDMSLKDFRLAQIKTRQDQGRIIEIMNGLI